MADKNELAKVDKVEKTLPHRIHINEFLATHAHHLSEMAKAGFKATVKKEWMRVDEWLEKFKEYNKK